MQGYTCVHGCLPHIPLWNVTLTRTSTTHTATFISCFFLDDPDTLVGLESAIEQSLNMYTIRIYGGHIFHAGGDLGASVIHVD